MFTEYDYYPHLLPTTKDFKPLLKISQNRAIVSFVQKMMWPLHHRQIIALGTKIIDKDSKRLFQFSESVFPGEKWFGCTIPEVDKGNVFLKVTKQCDIIQKIDDKHTKFISIMSNDPNMYVPSSFLNYIMKNVCFGMIKNIMKKAKELEKNEIFHNIMKRPER